MSTSSDSIEELVRRYARAAAAHGQANETAGDPVIANNAADEVAAVYRELRSRGLEAQRALLPLLEDDDVSVRVWAAAHALEFAPAEAEPVLRAAENIPKSLVSFGAKMTLKQWREGKLRFP